MGQRYRRMEDQKLGPGLTCNLDFAKEKGLEPNLKRFPKLSNLGDMVSKLIPRRIIDVGLTVADGRFFAISLKK